METTCPGRPNALPPYNLATLRAEEFPWTLPGEMVYLNNAATGPLPQRAVDTLYEWAKLRAQPWRVTDQEMVFPTLSRARTLCAELISAKPTEIALVPNTSYGLSLAARALPFASGDVVLASDGEFPSVVYAWQAVERSRGIQLKLLPTSDGLLNENALMDALDWPRVRAVTVSSVSFATGYKVDLERLGTACRKRQIHLVVDAIQGLGPATLNARASGADIVACGGYKWLLSPWGTGFLYIREELIEQLDPPVVGWFIGPGSENFARLLDYNLTYFNDARRFELMALPAQDLAAMARSVELLLELGPDAVERYVRTLADRIVAWALDRTEMRLITPAESSRRAGIVAIVPPNPQEASKRLRAAGVVHSLREGAIRLAPYFYNTTEEVDAALRVLGGE